MITVQGISNYDKTFSSVITIGTFDGVHVGHKKILGRLIADAKSRGLTATVLTFFPHPRMVLQKDSDIKLLNTIAEKTQILEEMGLDCLVIHPFTPEFSRLTANEFVRDVLVASLGTKKIIIGYDHRFGRNRNANITDLKEYGSLLDFEVEEISAQEINEVSVSSTKIRQALDKGDIQLANSFLGYAFMLSGIVQKGKGLGRTIDFPTANIFIEETYKLIPKNGVYFVQTIWNGATVYGMMNIGYNPTVSGTERRIEVHFLNFSEDLYGKHIQIAVLERLRDEQKFESVAALKAQLYLDKETSIALIKK